MEDKNLKINETTKALRAKYLREWRAKNKDKVREYNRTYWVRKAEKELSKQHVED